jgi:hypothetical protein
MELFGTALVFKEHTIPPELVKRYNLNNIETVSDYVTIFAHFFRHWLNLTFVSFNDN